MMGKHYSGPGFGVSPLEEKMADKDYDGDGKVESGKEEYFGSKDKAIKKAMKNEEATVEEGYKSLPADKMKAQQKGKSDPAQARKMEVVRKATQGSEGMVKDAVKGQEMSNRKKGLEKKFAAPSANKSNKNKAYELEGQRRRDLDNRYGNKKEETSITKEMVIEYLVLEGYASNEVSAEILHTHVSDEFLEQIEESLCEDYVVEGDAAPGVSGEEAMNRHGITPHEGPMKVTKLKPGKARKDGKFGIRRKMANPMPMKPGATGAENPGGKAVQG
jgi:hypothetical protein